jgi:hypothetical protein
MTEIPIVYQSKKPVKFPITPEIHAAIERVYLRDSGNGQVRALAIRLNYPRWKISRYAIRMGWVPKQKKEPDWTEREIKILERSARYCPEVIQKKLKQYGFQRSATAIVLKRKRLRLLQNLDGMSATSLANCLGVDVHFVLRAIYGGRLKAQKRGTRRTKEQGGDIWHIKEKDILKYILSWLNEIDIRKVSKWWFVDLLMVRNLR